MKQIGTQFLELGGGVGRRVSCFANKLLHRDVDLIKVSFSIGRVVSGTLATGIFEFQLGIDWARPSSGLLGPQWCRIVL